MSETQDVVIHSTEGGPAPRPAFELHAEFVRDLIAAQREFKPALRSEENDFFNSKYVPLDAAWEAVREALWTHNITVIQTVQVDDKTGPVLMTELIHVNGVSRTSLYPIVVKDKDNPQQFGSGLTYARRYALFAITMVCPEDDDGNAAMQPAATTGKAPARAASAPRTRQPAPDPGREMGPVTITKVYREEKQGRRGPYNKYDVVFSDGVKLTTLDGSTGAMAEACFADQTPVTYSAVVNGQYTNLGKVTPQIPVVEVDNPADLPF